VPRPGKESRRSVAELLGLRAGVVAAVVGAPGDYRRILGHVPAGVLFLPHAAGNLDFVHVFAAKRSILRDRFDAVMGSIKPNGTIWVSWAETSGVPTDLTEAAVREEARAHGLVCRALHHLGEPLLQRRRQRAQVDLRPAVGGDDLLALGLDTGQQLLEVLLKRR